MDCGMEKSTWRVVNSGDTRKFWRYLVKLFYVILSGLRPGEQGDLKS